MSGGFENAFDAIVGVEGGYTRDPADPGNWTGGRVGAGVLRGTKFGISAASFPTLDIAALTRAAAMAIYRPRYWDRIAGDALPARVALIAFDAAVNQGVGFAARTLQEAAGADPVDGNIGKDSVAAVLRHGNNLAALLVEIAARRAVRYAAGDMARFGLGWMRRLMGIAAQAFA